MKNKNNGGYAAITTVIILALVLGAFVLTTLTIVENNYKAQKTAFARQQEIYTEQGDIVAFMAQAGASYADAEAFLSGISAFNERVRGLTSSNDFTSNNRLVTLISSDKMEISTVTVNNSSDLPTISITVHPTSGVFDFKKNVSATLICRLESAGQNEGDTVSVQSTEITYTFDDPVQGNGGGNE